MTIPGQKKSDSVIQVNMEHIIKTVVLAYRRHTPFDMVEPAVHINMEMLTAV